MFANEEVKFMIKSKVLVLTGVFCTLMGFSHLSTAADTNPELRLNNAGSVGFVPTHKRPITSNRTNDLSASGVTLSDERVLSTLGCGALDNHEARVTILNTDDSTLNEYFNTSVSNYMVTTLFNSPAVAQIFNGLENFAGSRVRELQDRCAAMEYKDELAPAQWQAVQNCIQSYMEQEGSTGPSVTAQAFKFCLSSPDYIEQTGETLNKTLIAATEQVLDSPKWNGTLYSALQNTSACIQTTTGRNCTLLALLPNIRWCTNSSTASYTNCADGSESASLDSAIVASSEVRVSPESISPIQIFDLAFGLSEGFTNYAQGFAKALVKATDRNLAYQIAIDGENVDGGHVETIADYDDVMAGNVNDGVDEGPGALIDPPFLEDAFKNYVNCSAPLSGSGIPEWENFTPMVAAYDITTTAPFLPPPLDAGTFYGDQLNVNFGSGHSDNSDPTVNNIDVSAILELVEYGVKCSLRNDLRLTLAEYIALTDDADSGSADAVLLGYRTQVAYAVTHNILSFLIHRLELAQLDLSAIVSTDRNAPPQYVRGALDTLIGSYKRKLDSFERKRLQQKDYAQMISKLYNSRGSN